MLQKLNTFAFIDQQNLYTELKKCGWSIDYVKFRVYLKEKYLVSRAYIFIGFIEGNEDMYEAFNDAGFECIFRPTSKNRGMVKGNCDSELVLHTMRLFDMYEKAIVVSGDGDFASLVEYLIFHGKLKALIVPNRERYSGFLKRFRGHTVYVNDLKNKIQKKTPLGTEP